MKVRVTNSKFTSGFRLTIVLRPEQILANLASLLRPGLFSRPLASLPFRRALATMSSSSSSFTSRPLVVCGPSGTGKSTLLKKLFADHPEMFGFSISHTTRQPRSGEKEGVSYHFVDMETFEKLIDDGAFIENAKFSGNRYGTTAAAVAAVASQNRRCILDIDTQGVKLIKANHPQLNPVFLFLAPPSIAELTQRLKGRGTESEESLNARLAAAVSEIQYAVEGGHDIIVVNDDVERAYKLLEQIALGKEDVKGDELPKYDL